MVLTKDELILLLRNEVRILLHLAGKVDPAMLDYRPTPKQRSTLELLRYMSMMPTEMLAAIRRGAFDPESWQAATEKANSKGFDQVVAAIGALPDPLAAEVGEMSDAELREELDASVFGVAGSRGQTIVALVVSAFAAYRMQLFLYLKACGREELNTMNLWAGADRPKQD